jgi:hypothetical protein
MMGAVSSKNEYKKDTGKSAVIKCAGHTVESNVEALIKLQITDALFSVKS